MRILLKDVNLNGALEGSELETFINPPNVNWYESEVAHLIQKCDRNDDKLISKVIQTLPLNRKFQPEVDYQTNLRLK